MKKHCLLSLLTVWLCFAGAALPAMQKIPPLADTPGVSAFLIKPSEGAAEIPTGWKRNIENNYNNSQLAGEFLSATGDTEPCVTIKKDLPKASYTIFILTAGTGRARIENGAWVELNISGKYQWVELGTVPDTETVRVDVMALSASFRYAGLLACGDRLPVIPVDAVREKLQKGEPVTIALVGDSVTENAKGFRGGSSSFEKGNPGSFKAMLEKEFGNPVAYTPHRDPADWPESTEAETDDFPTVTVDGTLYREGRVDADSDAAIRLINMGKGGAASDDAWMRFPETFTEPGGWHMKNGRWLDTRRTDLPPILRIGLSGYKPDMVILNFGTNDANGSHKGRTAEDYLFFMKTLLTAYQHQLGAAVILSTPHKWTRGTHQLPHTQPEMTHIIRTFAKENGFHLADIYNEYGPNDYDGIHPGDSGHAHMAAAYMKALLNEPSVPSIGKGAAAAQFKENRKGTVSDKTTGLMWMKDAGLAKEPVAMDQAKEFIVSLNEKKAEGHDDWRLPTREEMLTLLAFDHYDPALPEGHPFINVGRWYLSTTDERGYPYGVDFHTGTAYFPGDKKAKGLVWPVRDL